ncbi:sulfur carrier protein ThiS [Vibrio sp. TH_r3]|uniref:sulfur carrier protein ThiS n=1 Tax=Vibrio sp. TH_r3 TaxID=3082084 RepID=UPI002953BC72|nr:sulfur carrier protein ThiS [Vibrio sp. TH_r3]MDV7106219.1 sulfur carrier protein ThiS [Vibrio sp. TH_r3]
MNHNIEVEVNGKLVNVAKNMSLAEVITIMGLSSNGSAVAVGTRIIGRKGLDSYIVSEGEKISVFQAIAGG